MKYSLAEEVKDLLVRNRWTFQEGYAGLHDITFYIPEMAEPDSVIRVKFSEIILDGEEVSLEEIREILR